MSAGSAPPTPGDVYARLLLGAMGVMVVVVGLVATWFFRASGPFGISPSLVIVAWGLNLLYGCAYFDRAEILSSPLGFPYVRVHRSKRPPGSPRGSDEVEEQDSGDSEDGS